MDQASERLFSLRDVICIVLGAPIQKPGILRSNCFTIQKNALNALVAKSFVKNKRSKSRTESGGFKKNNAINAVSAKKRV